MHELVKAQALQVSINLVCPADGAEVKVSSGTIFGSF
jgi:hypothetical protein